MKHSKMPVKATPYQHQINAFNFVCKLFGILEGGDAFRIFRSNGAALFMEMG